MAATSGVVLDSGAFIALERRNRVMVALAKLYSDQRTPMVTSAGVVAQVWRGGEGAQVPIALLLRRTRVFDLTHPVARMLGRMLGSNRSRDPVDAHVAFLAHAHDFTVLTSDPEDLLRIDPTLRVERI